MRDLWPEVQTLLPKVERPSRYIASEWGLPNSLEGNLSFCMIYPDTYELGQANQAVRILVNAVNREDGLFAERAFLPAVDMIDLMREEGVVMFSLEGAHPVADFDVVGITLPHELAATNVLEALDLSGIPIHAKDRSQDDPIVIAGGPCTFNPEPYAMFFDAFCIGEGEEAIPEVLRVIEDCKKQGLSREETLGKIALVDGFYVPSLYDEVQEDSVSDVGAYLIPKEGSGASQTITRRIFEGFAHESAWEPMYVPFPEVAHDRLNVEILRGCARGCRFCQAGMMYRPVRERSADNIVDAVVEGLGQTGYDEVSLTSLSSTDHSCVAEILDRLNERFEGSGIRISIPSQRIDSFGVEMAEKIAGQKKGGLTFAPEAGSSRLRDVINKNVTEDDLISSLNAAMDAGWRRAKLYFMIGLPTETDEDVIAIADLANAAFEAMRERVPASERGKLSLNVSISLFVPKAQTPFQWCGQISPEEAKRRVGLIKRAIKHRPISVKYHEPKTSLIEAVMSRGGRKIGELVELAWRNGARFDAWTEHFNEDAWKNASEALGMDMGMLAQESFEPTDVMPFQHISSGASWDFLVREYNRALREETTKDCTFDGCTGCGICDFDIVRNELVGSR